MDYQLGSEEVIQILGLIRDGSLFERFGQDFLSARFGYSFIPAGGVKDRGIDGIIYPLRPEHGEKDIFQISISKNHRTKIKETVDKLLTQFGPTIRITYFTNMQIRDQDKIIDDYFEENINLRIFDASWIGINANHSNATRGVVTDFIRKNLRQYQNPGEVPLVSDYVSDPKLYVYLMQQISRNKSILNLNESLIDSLILYSLRETDPDQGKLMSSVEIVSHVEHLVSFEIEGIRSRVNRRLNLLSSKPIRKIKHHTKLDRYCLPYQTRLEMTVANGRDQILYDRFHEEAEDILKRSLGADGVSAQKISLLLNKILEKIYYHQGLEFADFMLNKAEKDAFEISLETTVDEVQRWSHLPVPYRENVK